MAQLVKNYWRGLEPRERLVLGLGTLIVGTILFYALIWQPWHKAIVHMETTLQPMRSNLQWIRQQAEIVKNGSGTAVRVSQGQGESLLSIVEKTANLNKLTKAIQQISPGQNEREVRVILEEASFNQWVKWIDMLFQQYSVSVKQVTAERESSSPDTAEIRITFERL